LRLPHGGAQGTPHALRRRIALLPETDEQHSLGADLARPRIEEQRLVPLPLEVAAPQHPLHLAAHPRVDLGGRATRLAIPLEEREHEERRRLLRSSSLDDLDSEPFHTFSPHSWPFYSRRSPKDPVFQRKSGAT